MNQDRDRNKNINKDINKDINSDLNKQGRFGEKPTENVGQSGLSGQQYPGSNVKEGQNLGFNQEAQNLDQNKNKNLNKDNIGFSSGLK